MSSKQGIRLASSAAIVFLVLHVPVILCKNADISGCDDSKLVNSLLTLSCRYMGKRKEDAIFWYNSSNSDILALRSSSDVPQCDVFSAIDTSFDPHRISYTCNNASNVYTLTINPLRKLDNNVTWSCTFLDPAPNPVKAECIIHVSETTEDTGGGHTIPVLISIVCNVILIAVIIFAVIIFRKRKRGPNQIEQETEALQQELAEKAKTNEDCEHNQPLKESET